MVPGELIFRLSADELDELHTLGGVCSGVVLLQCGSLSHLSVWGTCLCYLF